MGRHRDNGRDYAPFEDDYRGFDVREDDSTRGPLILALAVGVLLVFGAVVWNTYRQGVRDNGAGIPSVIADKEPYKRAPEDREGVAVPDTEKRFYDQMDDSERSEEQGVDYADRGSLEGDALQGGPPIELRPGLEGAEPDDAQVRALADLETMPEDEEETLRVVPTNPVAQAPAPAPVPRSLPVPAEPGPQFAFTSDGVYQVQLAAFRSQDAAETAWAKMNSAKPDLYRNGQKRIQRADLGAKGVFYRLRVGSFAERADASEFCDAVKAGGDNCIVVTG
ncbi:MAG: SPOR domain-containing protein [Hyphomonas sp.]|jgi:cell division protein FtsN|uniref:SPOR domain-containing protein n=2 Tax=Hyphomonas sp. TaxID=87 RepID=UPI003262EF50